VSGVDFIFGRILTDEARADWLRGKTLTAVSDVPPMLNVHSSAHYRIWVTGLFSQSSRPA